MAFKFSPIEGSPNSRYHIEMQGPVSALLELSARRNLVRLDVELGFAAAIAIPAVSAAVDQHAAAVRDILEIGVEDAAVVPAAVLLAGYAGGLLDQAHALGRSPAMTGMDWLGLRLLGVCAQARANDSDRAGRHCLGMPTG